MMGSPNNDPVMSATPGQAAELVRCPDCGGGGGKCPTCSGTGTVGRWLIADPVLSLAQYELVALADLISKLDSMCHGYGPGDTSAHVVTAVVSVGGQQVVIGYDEAGDLCLLGRHSDGSGLCQVEEHVWVDPGRCSRCGLWATARNDGQADA